MSRFNHYAKELEELTLEAVKELGECRGDRVRRIRADRAAIRRHHTVCGGFVQTADDTLAFALVDELRLVAVACGFGRGRDPLDGTELAGIFAADMFFVAELFLIGEVTQLTGIAFFRVLTKIVHIDILAWNGGFFNRLR